MYGHERILRHDDNTSIKTLRYALDRGRTARYRRYVWPTYTNERLVGRAIADRRRFADEIWYRSRPCWPPIMARGVNSEPEYVRRS